MNKIKMLITTLILGTSAAAFAAPAQAEWRQPAPAPTATVQVQPQWQREHKAHWITLASSAQIRGTKEYIRVGAQLGKFDKIELQQLSGKTQIKLVQINFANGQSQLARVNTTLDRNNTTATIPLTGQNRSIASITVYGSGNARSTYNILAA